MSAVANIEQFRALKWGEKLITQTPAEMTAILKECEPLAKYGRIRVEKVLSVVMVEYLEQQADSKPQPHRGAN